MSTPLRWFRMCPPSPSRVMTTLDVPRAWWDEGGGSRFFRPRLEDTMRGLNPIHVPHFQHFSVHSALVSARDKLGAHSIEITITLVTLVGLLIALTFWAVVAR